MTAAVKQDKMGAAGGKELVALGEWWGYKAWKSESAVERRGEQYGELVANQQQYVVKG